MSVPHVQRHVTDVDRTIVQTPLDETYARLLELPTVLADHEAVRLDAWPEGGLRAPGDDFWAVHSGLLPGHAVHYLVRELDPPTGIELEASSDLHTAVHRVVLAPGGEAGCEIVWSCRLDSERPLSQGLLDDAALLGRTVLRRLTDTDAPVEVGAATGRPVL